MFRLALVSLTTLVTATWLTSESLDGLAGLSQPSATLVAGVTASLGSVLIGALALFFAWRNTQATLRQQLLMAERQEVARVESDAHKSIALWLGKHPVLREGETLYFTYPFEPHLSVPGNKLLVKSRLFAADNVWELVLRMRDTAYLENELVRNVQLVIQSSQSRTTYPLARHRTRRPWAGSHRTTRAVTCANCVRTGCLLELNSKTR